MICTLCPRNCGAERTGTKAGGYCAMPSLPRAAKAMLHLWEEPCLVGEHGAGTVFFSGCNLRCRFCQNGVISQGGEGIPVTPERLREIYWELIRQGAACVDLVTPTHFTDAILESLSEPLPVPVVWNSGGYEKPETLRRLQGKVQIYLPDLKYALPGPAKAYSGAEDYFDWASAAILEMFRQTGPYRMENGLLRSGVVIRHLLLPGEAENTRRCGVERTPDKAAGVCAMPAWPVAARAMLHQWEEPCLVGERGAGAVFFSGCNLRCKFCQNGVISQEGYGKPITPRRLREIFEELVEQGAACLDLVTPTHFTDAVLEALGEEHWPVPVVWNCGGYESVETLKRLEGRVQVYLPDLKYALTEPAKAYSGAADYPETAKAAILEMFRQTGPYRMENGQLRSGVLIRHLVLPGELENTKAVIDWVAETFRPGDVLFSLMSQYTPQPGAEGKLARRVTRAEYRAAAEYMANCCITDGYTQERTSAREEYTPDFDLSGL